jgi:hypothetical protein
MFQIKHGKKSKSIKRSNSILFKLSVLHALKKKRWVSGTFIFKKAIENVKPLFIVKKQKNFVQVIPLKSVMQQKNAHRI